MQLFCTLTVLLTTACLPTTISQRQALFIKKDVVENGKRVARETESADQMVQNILQWLQGVYTSNSRRIRQGTLREYLPPPNTQKPRPFQPVAEGSINSGNYGYPPAGSITPRPPFSVGDGGVSYLPPHETPVYNGYTSSKPFPTFPPPTSGYPTPTGYPTGPTGYPTGPTGFPSTGYPSPTGPTQGYPSTGYPPVTNGYPTGPSTAYPAPSTGYPTTSFPSPTPGYPGPSTAYPSPGTGYPTSTPGPTGPPTTFPGPTTGYPTTSPPFQTFPTEEVSTPYPTDSQTYEPSNTQPPFTSFPQTTSEPITIPTFENTIPNELTTEGEFESTTELPEDADKHPPHIHAIDVECSKEMMTINIEFNKEYNGIIYSKGHFNEPECRYVKENTGQTKFSFTVNLNSCGTQFVNAFDTEGKSYLENVLVLQNEPAIQEVWDTVRAVRCLWEGNLKKALNVALSVDMLHQEIVTFSGDTAMAKLDIQIGKGPFAPPAKDLVKIGEVMTLVVSVTGDPGFDIQVKDCRAKDSSGENSVALTDDRGCVLKTKIFGAFQKTRNTGNTGASIIAYAYFNAFKFPDVMDLVMECNVDLCKTDCEICPEAEQKLEPGRRRRRDLYSSNSTEDNSVTMGKTLRVILPEDLSDSQTIDVTQNEGVCMSTEGFVFSSAILISLLSSSCLFSAYIWLKHQYNDFKK